MRLCSPNVRWSFFPEFSRRSSDSFMRRFFRMEKNFPPPLSPWSFDPFEGGLEAFLPQARYALPSQFLMFYHLSVFPSGSPVPAGDAPSLDARSTRLVPLQCCGELFCRHEPSPEVRPVLPRKSLPPHPSREFPIWPVTRPSLSFSRSVPNEGSCPFPLFS